jgi:hypothetical protein
MQLRAFAAALACLTSPSGPRPSDYTPMVYLLFAGLAVVTVFAFFAVLLMTRSTKNRWLKLLLRVLPITILWSFAPLGHAGLWWPAPFGVLFGELEQKLYALSSMLVTSAAVYGLCGLVLLAGHRDRT